MPVINIEYDIKRVTEDEIRRLSEAMHEIVSRVTSIEDVPVYSTSPSIQIEVSPIEVFVKISAHKVADADKLIADIKSNVVSWKKENNFTIPINLTLIPMQWKIEIGI